MAEDDDKREGLSLWQVVASTVAAAIGVQSKHNRRRDFERGRAWHFLFAGIGFTVLFVLTLWLVVDTVLRTSSQ